jgi:hypothetical protein
MKTKKTFKRNNLSKKGLAKRLIAKYKNQNTNLLLGIIIAIVAMIQNETGGYFNRGNLAGMAQIALSLLCPQFKGWLEELKSKTIKIRMCKIEEHLHLKAEKRGHHKNNTVRLRYKIFFNTNLHSFNAKTDDTNTVTNNISIQDYESFIINTACIIFREVLPQFIEINKEFCGNTNRKAKILMEVFARLIPLETENFQKMLENINYRTFFKKLIISTKSFNVRGRKETYQKHGVTPRQFHSAIEFAEKREKKEFSEELCKRLKILGDSYVLKGKKKTYSQVFNELKVMARKLIQNWHGYRWKAATEMSQYKDRKGVWREKVVKFWRLVKVPKEWTETARKWILGDEIDYYGLTSAIQRLTRSKGGLCDP